MLLIKNTLTSFVLFFNPGKLGKHGDSLTGFVDDKASNIVEINQAMVVVIDIGVHVSVQGPVSQSLL